MCLPIALENSPVFLPSSQEAKVNHCQGCLQGTAKALLAFLKGLPLEKKKFDFFPPGLISPFLCPFLPTKGRAFHFPARDVQKGLAPSRSLPALTRALRAAALPLLGITQGEFLTFPKL